MIAALLQNIETGISDTFGTLNHRHEDLGTLRGDLSSWVPRWHLPWDSRWNAASTRGDFRACGSKRLVWLKTTGPDNIVLMVKGLRVCRIKHVERVWLVKMPNSALGVVHDPDTVATRLGHISSAITLHDGSLTGLPQTLVAGDLRSAAGQSSSPTEVEASFRALLTRLIYGVTSAGDEDAAALEVREARALRYHNAMQVACGNRRFFISDDGRIGLGPRVMRVGDLVAIFWGFKRPVVLRPSTKGQYRLCDEAYIHDLMDGRWTDAQVDAGIKDEVFSLY